MLQDILTVNATLVGQAQNEELKGLTEASYTQNEGLEISAWRLSSSPHSHRHGVRHELRPYAGAALGRRREGT
jgi:hypothetical protein